MKSVLAILFLLPSLTLAKGGDLSDYGYTTCEYGQCKLSLPLTEDPDNAQKDCEAAFRAAYEIIKASGKVIVEKTACKDTIILAQDIQNGKWVGNKKIHFVSGEITFIQ